MKKFRGQPNAMQGTVSLRHLHVFSQRGTPCNSWTEYTFRLPKHAIFWTCFHTWPLSESKPISKPGNLKLYFVYRSFSACIYAEVKNSG